MPSPASGLFDDPRWAIISAISSGVPTQGAALPDAASSMACDTSDAITLSRAVGNAHISRVQCLGKPFAHDVQLLSSVWTFLYFCMAYAMILNVLIAISILRRSRRYHRWDRFSLTGRDFEPISCRERNHTLQVPPYRNTFDFRHTYLGSPWLQHGCGRAVPDCRLLIKARRTHENGTRMRHTRRQPPPAGRRAVHLRCGATPSALRSDTPQSGSECR